ncbi:MAG: hypothetical protein IKP40_04695 [Clostridia bacterium]|nr:hypothetical protein [Clostridia bacterium]
MTNKEVYQKTIGFSIRRLLWDLLSLVALCGAIALGAVIDQEGVAGVLIGFLIGVVIMVIILRFVSYTYKAGQIAMMTKAVTEDSLPEDVIGEGKRVVKERFATVALYYAATRIIRGIFNQIGRGITKIGESIGGDTGSSIGSAISSIISVVVAYLCDCCLGWIFYRRDEQPVKATLQGAALFFKHGKTFLKNMGRVFGLGLVSLVTIGGVSTGVCYLILSRFPAAFNTMAAELKTSLNPEEMAPWLYSALTNGSSLILVAAVIAALLVWNFLHSNFVRPFVLVGVLRNYMQAGIENMPTEASYAAVAKVSPKFAKEMAKAA